MNNSYTGRGLFLGIEELLQNSIFTTEELPLYIHDLATVLANLHFQAMNDGFDLEVFVGRNAMGVSVLYIGDFDLTEIIVEFNDYVIDRLVWCLYAVPYFPRPNNSDLFKIFKDAYIEQASLHNRGDVATIIMNRYIQDCSYD
jgi:hypothetical protein